MDSSLTKVAQKYGILAHEDSIKVERNILPKELERYETENEQWKKLISEKDAAVEAISACLLDIVR